MSNLHSKFVDKFGQPVNINRSNQLQKKAFGLNSSIYEYPNSGRYRPRVYTNQDSELGINQYSRDLLVRWSREMAYQSPWIYAGIKLLSFFSIGDQYIPFWIGENKNGDEYIKYLKEVFYKNCCTRGYDYQTVISLTSEIVDIDGDILKIYGEDETGPKIQLIPTHRIRAASASPYGLSAQEGPKAGPYPNTIVSDGVVYTNKGTPIAYSVMNPNNMVNSSFGGDVTNVFVSARNSKLAYIPRMPDRGRGFPTITSGILQALSISEIEAYMMDKLKIQSMYAVVEKTPEGEGPLEEEMAYRRAASNITSLQGFGVGSQPNSNASQGLRIVDNPAIKYVSCAGGDIKFPAASITDSETSEYVARLERGVLSCLGVPHALLFSPDDVSGKMNSSVVEIFNGAITKRQQFLDGHAKFDCTWALAKAIENKELPPCEDEMLYECLDFTHPPKFSIDDARIRQSDNQAYDAGTITLDEIARKNNTSAQEIIQQRAKEATMIVKGAQDIVKETGIDVSIALQMMRDTLKSKSPSTPPLEEKQ